ncbi:MAG: TetR/AcrR family transcriptional regulator [Spirochaetia bacterium]
MSKRGRPVIDSAAALTRDKIVRAAVQIVDRDGLAALSMRHLGAALGVDAMAIYYYVPKKAALYDAIVEAVMDGVDTGPAAGPSPRAAIEQLREMSLSYRDALLAHPNALPVVATRPVRTEASLRPIERMRAVIARLGFSPQESIAFVDVCCHYILGWAQARAAHLQGSGPHDSDDPFAVEFELGITAILNGLLAAAESRTVPGPHERAQPSPWAPDAD